MTIKLFYYLKLINKNIQKILSSIIAFITLFFVYFVVVGIVSIIAKIAGKSFLNLKNTDSKLTYWKDKNLKTLNRDSYYNLF